MMDDKRKVITIVDCFIHNKRVEEKLIAKLKKIRGEGQEVLLVTNSSNICSETILNCDYVIYNSKNNLFEKKYDGISTVDFWCNHGSFVSHSFSGGLQRHGLSVLINIFSSLLYIKNLGFTHFQRLEVDDIFSEEGENFILNTVKRIEDGDLDGIFYLNESFHPFDISFHYFCCEIDIFLGLVKNVFSEDDYRKILAEDFGSLNFVIAEEFIYKFIKRISENPDSKVELRSGSVMDLDFPDTLWNTETSPSNTGGQNSGIFTGLYVKKMQDDSISGLVYYSRNLEESPRSFRVLCYQDDLEIDSFYHILPGRGNWCYNDIKSNCSRVEVYEGDSLIMSSLCDVDNISNYIKFN
jgi:hypothetical protein